MVFDLLRISSYWYVNALWCAMMNWAYKNRHRKKTPDTNFKAEPTAWRRIQWATDTVLTSLVNNWIWKNKKKNISNAFSIGRSQINRSSVQYRCGAYLKFSSKYKIEPIKLNDSRPFLYNSRTFLYHFINGPEAHI